MWFGCPMKDLIGLIFDDNPFDCRTLATILRAYGFKQIISTYEFVEAYKLVNQQQPPVVFIDIVLIEGNGLFFLVSLERHQFVIRQNYRWLSFLRLQNKSGLKKLFHPGQMITLRNL